MVQQIKSGERTARKHRLCQMCSATIRIGDRYHVSTNVHDGRMYDFCTCLPCERDGIMVLAYVWADCPDEGVAYEQAYSFAEDVAYHWPMWLDWSGQVRRRVTTNEHRAARNWLARAAGGEGE